MCGSREESLQKSVPSLAILPASWDADMMAGTGTAIRLWNGNPILRNSGTR